MIPLSYYLILAAAMFTIGVYGVMSQRNGIIILMCIELMLNAANINLIAFSTQFNTVSGHVFVLLSIAVAAAEAAIGFAILLLIFKSHEDIDLTRVNLLRW